MTDRSMSTLRTRQFDPQQTRRLWIENEVGPGKHRDFIAVSGGVSGAGTVGRGRVPKGSVPGTALMAIPRANQL